MNNTFFDIRHIFCQKSQELQNNFYLNRKMMIYFSWWNQDSQIVPSAVLLNCSGLICQTLLQAMTLSIINGQSKISTDIFHWKPTLNLNQSLSLRNRKLIDMLGFQANNPLSFIVTASDLRSWYLTIQLYNYCHSPTQLRIVLELSSASEPINSTTIKSSSMHKYI